MFCDELFGMLLGNHLFEIGEPKPLECPLCDPVKIQAQLTGSSDTYDNDAQQRGGTEINQSR